MWVLVSLLFISVSVWAQEVRLTKGIVEDQVFQRDRHNAADLKFSGIVLEKGLDGKSVEARILLRSNVVSGFDWAPIAKVRKMVWSAELKRIPTGGPYRLEIRVQGSRSSISANGLLVGDIWVLIGQSNMEGLGELINVTQPSPLVHNFDMADVWTVAKEPLHTTVNAADRVHWPVNKHSENERMTGDVLARYQSQRKRGAGFALPFAVQMVERVGVPIGLMPSAHAGTSLSQWDPDRKDEGGDSLYGAMYRRFQAVGGKVRGVLLYQGESDAKPGVAQEFLKRFERLVKSLREDLQDPTLPVYYVQIGRHISAQNTADWNAVQEAQLRAESMIRNSGMVSSIDLGLSDAIHIDTQELKRLGKRLADLVCRDLFSGVKDFGEIERGPRPVSARSDQDLIRVVFSQVNGALQAAGRVSGFTVHNESGDPIPIIYRAEIDPLAGNTVLLHLAEKLPEKATLRYGYGKDPYCNVTDALDLAIPVFGPVPIT